MRYLIKGFKRLSDVSPVSANQLGQRLRTPGEEIIVRAKVPKRLGRAKWLR